MRVDTTIASYIDENNCIGCTKCVKACPNDAIIGSKNQIHVVIEQWCRSCGECLSVCPTDCISIVTKKFSNSKPVENFAKKIKRDDLYRENERYFNIEQIDKSKMIEELEVFLNEEDKNYRDV